jgi:predicted ATP-grasp superfamily ATP-dependent carboligase
MSTTREHEVFEELAKDNIPAIFIAPEFSANLYAHAARYRLHGGPLLSPGPEVIILCADKFSTCRHLAHNGVPIPREIIFEKFPEEVPEGFFPAVLKPVDGCGSLGVQMIESLEELAAVDLSYEIAVDLHTDPTWILEKYHPGTHVSVSVLTGPLGVLPLQPCTQRLSDDGHFSYLGGETPIPEHLAERAKRLAKAAAETLPNCRGYIGIDMVLGSAENGSQDVVIEINPRLTTSYLILRQACEQNLAEAMLKWAAGEPIELTWRPQRFEFAVPAS